MSEPTNPNQPAAPERTWLRQAERDGFWVWETCSGSEGEPEYVPRAMMDRAVAEAWSLAAEAAKLATVKAGPSGCSGFEERWAHNQGANAAVRAIEDAAAAREEGKSDGDK
jgi:hypothetical protein